MGFFDKDKPETTTIDGKPFNCLVCHNDGFWRRDAQLHTAVASFFGVSWAEPSATCLVCANCGYIHWFLPN
jgi:hypothetical protein